MGFEDEKSRYLSRLYKPDKSRKGMVDEEISPLIDAINKDSDYYTTSSCAGRISLFVESESGKKCDSYWHFVTHQPVSFEELVPFLSDLPKNTLWFRMEGAIIHVVARNESAANRFLHNARASGFKHSGLLSSTKRLVIECIDSERIDVPISVDGSLIVDVEFVKFLISEANKKLLKTREKIMRLKTFF